MMGLGKRKLYTKLEVASFSHRVNIEAEPPSPGPHLIFFWLNLMMALGKSQFHAKFKVAGFIYYGNIREYFEIGLC